MPARTRALTRFAALTAALLAVALVVPAAPATAATAVPNCGKTIYKPDGTPWTCTFADDFNGFSLDRTKWVPQVTATSGYGQSGACFVDSTQNISVLLGTLSLTARKASKPFICKDGSSQFATTVTSGMVTTYKTFAQAFGRFEFRASFPNTSTPGLQSSLWMWPDDLAASGSGEIDVAEWFSNYSDRVIPYLKYLNVDPTAQVTNNYCLVKRGTMHTYRLDWTPSTITISYDDKVCLQNSSWSLLGLLTVTPFHRPFILAMTQMLGSGNNAPTSRTPFPATMKVDYVRVWS